MAVDVMPVDVAIVGGSYAGLSAALQLARARRSVVVVDAGARRNRFAESSHGFLSRDGEAPAAIAAHGREQLLAYPNVRFVEGTADTAGRDGANLVVSVQGENIAARRLILATGVVDELPSIPGLQERWGRAVFHCPYCHGYELGQGRIGVLATGEHSFHQAMMLPDWGPTILFANEAFEPDAAQAAMLEARGVEIERERVVAVDGAKASVVSGWRPVRFPRRPVRRVAHPHGERSACSARLRIRGRTARTLYPDERGKGDERRGHLCLRRCRAGRGLGLACGRRWRHGSRGRA